MFTLFETVLNMSLTASVVILAVLLTRIFMKKAPRKFCYLLWLVVAFRLVIPFSFESAISIFNLGGEMPTVEIPQTGTVDTLPEEEPDLPGDTEVSAPVADAPGEDVSAEAPPQDQTPEEDVSAGTPPTVSDPTLPDWVTPGVTEPGTPEVSVPQSPLPDEEASVPGVTVPDTEAPGMTVPDATVSSPGETPVTPSAPVVTPAADPMELAGKIAAALWLAGIAVMLAYGLLSYGKLRKRLSTAILLEGNVYGSDRIDAPFALGVFKPRIYIPFGLSDSAKEYILAHERYHLKRLDHIVKPISFGILALHWFNPLCWLAFNRMSLDMELSCDEAVLARYGNETMKKQYTKTLLDFATNKKFPSPAPLSFSEGASAKTRIKNALYWKKPKVWLSVVAMLLSLVILVACAGNAISGVSDELSGETPEQGILTFGETPYEFTFLSNGDGTCAITDVLTDFHCEDKYDLVIPATSPAGDKVVEVDLAVLQQFGTMNVPPVLPRETLESLVEQIKTSDVESSGGMDNERIGKTVNAFYVRYPGKGYPEAEDNSVVGSLENTIPIEEYQRLSGYLTEILGYTEEQCYEDTLSALELEMDEASREFLRERVLKIFYRDASNISKVVLPSPDVKVHQGFLGLTYALADGTAYTPVYENPITLEIVTAEEAKNATDLDAEGNEVIAITSSRPVRNFHILTIDMADSVTAQPHPNTSYVASGKGFTETYRLLLGENIPTRGISFVGEDGKTYEYAICYVGYDGSYELVPLDTLTSFEPTGDYASMKVLRTVRGDLLVLEDPDAPASQRQVLVLKKNGLYTELHRDYNLITGYYDMSEAGILAFNNFEREVTAKAYLCFTDTGDKKEINLSALPEDETISYMKWLDPDHLLFVSQLDHGTIVEGGELWCYTTNDGSVQKLISIADPRLQITGLNVSSSTLTVKAVYFDEAYNFTESMHFDLHISDVSSRISKGEVFRLSPEEGLTLYAATPEEIGNNTFVNVTPRASVTNKYVVATGANYAYLFFCSYKAVGEGENGWMYEYTDTSSRIYLSDYGTAYVEASASTSITDTWGYCTGDRYYALMDDAQNGTQRFVDITDQITGPAIPEDPSVLFGENAKYYSDYARADFARTSILHIYAWDQYFVIRHSGYAPTYYPATLTITGDTALAFSAIDGGEHPDLGHPTMDMAVYRMEKGKSDVSYQTIDCYLLVEPKWLYSAVTDKVGYLSVFDIDEYSTEREHYLAYLYKTTDGGLTWEEVAVTNAPATGRGFEVPLMAKFLTEDFGVVSFVCDWDCDITEYTQYTNDGGKTWHNFDGLKNLPIQSSADMSVCDITLSEGVYTLTLVFSVGGNTTYEQVTSTDLENWKLIQKVVIAYATEEQLADTENYTHFYDTEAYEKFGMYNAYILVQVPAPIESFCLEALTEKGDGYSREVLFETTLTPDQPIIIHTYLNDAVPNRGYSYVDESGVRAHVEFGFNMKD